MDETPSTPAGAASVPVARRRSSAATVISVTLRPMFAESQTVTVPHASTVGQLLAETGYEGAEVRLISNGEASVLTGDQILEDGDVIQLVSGHKITNG